MGQKCWYNRQILFLWLFCIFYFSLLIFLEGKPIVLKSEITKGIRKQGIFRKWPKSILAKEKTQKRRNDEEKTFLWKPILMGFSKWWTEIAAEEELFELLFLLQMLNAIKSKSIVILNKVPNWDFQQVHQLQWFRSIDQGSWRKSFLSI